MTPNKLPPLPSAIREIATLESSGDTTFRVIAPAADDYYTADQMHAYAAEALRQSQSLPAGAVIRVTDEMLDAAVEGYDDAYSGEYFASGAVDNKREAIKVALVEALEVHREALRQSQSLPAGAVAGLVGKWREHGHAGNSSWGDGYMAAMKDCAFDLEQALQAEAREKGEADVLHPQYERGFHAGLRFEAANRILSDATQPAQASEADYPAEFKARLQAAVNAIKVPKMSPLKQELFKAGSVATINAINAALATSSQETASE